MERRILSQSVQICPHFADFSFTNWDKNAEVRALFPFWLASSNSSHVAWLFTCDVHTGLSKYFKSDGALAIATCGSLMITCTVYFQSFSLIIHSTICLITLAQFVNRTQFHTDYSSILYLFSHYVHRRSERARPHFIKQMNTSLTWMRQVFIYIYIYISKVCSVQTAVALLDLLG